MVQHGLSTNAPFALLYGSLVEAYTFMKGEPDVIQNYNGLYHTIFRKSKRSWVRQEKTQMVIELVCHRDREHRSRKWQQQMQQPPSWKIDF